VEVCAGDDASFSPVQDERTGESVAVAGFPQLEAPSPVHPIVASRCGNIRDSLLGHPVGVVKR